MYVCDLFACVYTRETSFYSLILRTFVCTICTELDSGQLLGLAQKPSMHFGHLFTVTMLSHAWLLRVCALVLPVFSDP